MDARSVPGEQEEPESPIGGGDGRRRVGRQRVGVYGAIELEDAGGVDLGALDGSTRRILDNPPDDEMSG